jgi:hypothetical protein
VIASVTAKIETAGRGVALARVRMTGKKVNAVSRYIRWVASLRIRPPASSNQEEMRAMKITRLEIANKGTVVELYVGDAISTRGRRYTFMTKEDGEAETAMRGDSDGRFHISTLVMAPPALRSATRLAVRNAVREAAAT